MASIRRKTVQKTPAKVAADADAALLAEIVAHPEEDAPRLVHADALLERGDPRGELIQLQCELARVDEDDERWHRMRYRERALLKAHLEEWTIDLNALGKNLSFELHRGFVEAVAGPAEELARVGSRLLQAAPLLARVTALAFERSVESFVRSALFARVRTIRLTSFRRRIELSSLRNVSAPVSLRRLELDEVGLVRSDLEALVDCQALTSLRELEINRCVLGKDSIAPLEALAAPLERFSLFSGKQPEHLVRALTRGAAFEGLRALLICNNPIGDDGVEALARSGRLGGLEELDLRSNELSARAISKVLDGALPTRGLRRLLLGGNELDDDIARQIARWPGAADLVKLDLGSPKIGAKGVLALAGSPHLGKLRSLVLSNCDVSKSIERKLLDSPHLTHARLYVGSRFLKRT